MVGRAENSKPAIPKTWDTNSFPGHCQPRAAAASTQHTGSAPSALAHGSPCPSVVPWWACVTCDRQYIISANYDKIGLILTEEWLDKSAVFVSHHTCFIWHHLHHLLLHTPLPSAETTQWGAQALLFWILFWLIHNQPIFYSGTIYFQWCEMSQKEYHLPIRCQGELRGMTIRMFLDVVRAVGMKCREVTEMQPFSVIFAVVLYPCFKVFPAAGEKRRQMNAGKRHNKPPCQVYA